MQNRFFDNEAGLKTTLAGKLTLDARLAANKDQKSAYLGQRSQKIKTFVSVKCLGGQNGQGHAKLQGHEGSDRAPWLCAFVSSCETNNLPDQKDRDVTSARPPKQAVLHPPR